jgi:hypothetical protein
VKSDTPKPRRLSEILQDLQGTPSLTIGELAKLMGERAFGALMFVFAVPNAIPTPPGTSAVLGLPLVFLTFQLMLGREALWLPKRIANRAVSGNLVAAFLRKALPWLVRIEKVLKPRLSPLIRNDLAERILGFVCFLLAVVLFLPIPFGNILPALAIAILALALAERDGLAALVGYAIAGASVGVLVLVSSAVWAAIQAFFNVLLGG